MNENKKNNKVWLVGSKNLRRMAHLSRNILHHKYNNCKQSPLHLPTSSAGLFGRVLMK